MCLCNRFKKVEIEKGERKGFFRLKSFMTLPDSVDFFAIQSFKHLHSVSLSHFHSIKGSADGVTNHQQKLITSLSKLQTTSAIETDERTLSIISNGIALQYFSDA